MFRCLSAIQQLQGGRQAEERGSSYCRKGDRGNIWAKFGCCKTSSSKKTLRENLAGPPSCLITQGTTLLQGFPDVGKVPEPSKAAVYSALPKQFDLGFLQFGLGFLPTAPCNLTMSLYNCLSRFQDRLDPPGISGRKSAAGRAAMHGMAKAILWAGSGPLRARRMPSNVTLLKS